ncbi:hypothetical protein EV421DRAFT_189421 [Armillaria borealis]|uniref:Uncharacterized protein n=1 Tax=Armillaria borealis TaxID=47425 RepID=A0AA39JSR0_9AGAR|nr:hypothetical protein EV421DRAFT_189421 [Armillaria borealis]
MWAFSWLNVSWGPTLLKSGHASRKGSSGSNILYQCARMIFSKVTPGPTSWSMQVHLSWAAVPPQDQHYIPRQRDALKYDIQLCRERDRGNWYRCGCTVDGEPMANSFFSNFTMELKLSVPWGWPNSLVPLPAPCYHPADLQVTPVVCILSTHSFQPHLYSFLSLVASSASRSAIAIAITVGIQYMHRLACEWGRIGERHPCALGLSIGCTMVPAGRRRHGMAVARHGEAVADTLGCREHGQALCIKG